MFIKGDNWLQLLEYKLTMMHLLTCAMQLRRPDEALSRARQAVQVAHH
jgi:hypothetical protein